MSWLSLVKFKKGLKNKRVKEAQMNDIQYIIYTNSWCSLELLLPPKILCKVAGNLPEGCLLTPNQLHHWGPATFRQHIATFLFSLIPKMHFGHWSHLKWLRLLEVSWGNICCMTWFNILQEVTIKVNYGHGFLLAFFVAKLFKCDAVV